MYDGKTTDELRAEREAREEIENAAYNLASGIVETYPDDNLEVELSELDDAFELSDEDERREEIVAWLVEFERESWWNVSADDEEAFLAAFEKAFHEAMGKVR